MYKTAEELGIEQWEFDALLRTKELLQGSNLEYKEGWWGDVLKRGTTGKKFFNMGIGAAGATTERYSEAAQRYKTYKCGTVACIGGWNHLLTHATPIEGSVYDADAINSADQYVGSVNQNGGSLRDLYFPPEYEFKEEYADITDGMAVQAIENFLTYGSPRWEEILTPVTDED